MCLSSRLLRVRRHAFSITGASSSTGLRHTIILSSPRRQFTSQSDAIRPMTPAEKLQTSINTRHLIGIHRDYVDATRRIWSAIGKEGKVTRRVLLSKDQLFKLLDLLAASGRPKDLSLIDKVFRDMAPIFLIEATDEAHDVVIRGLMRCGNVQTIYRWLMTMPQKWGQFTTIEHWLLFLEHCLKLGEVGMIRQSLKTMQQSGCKPTNEAFRIYIRALFTSDPRFRDVVQVFDDALREGLPFDKSTSALVYDSFAKIRRIDRAVQAQRLYREKFPEVSQGKRTERHTQISEEAQRGGTKAAVALCNSFQTRGFRPNGRTLTAVLRDSTSLADLQYAEEELHVRSNVVHWTLLIVNTIRLGDLPRALSIYTQSKEMGIKPDVAMVHPIITALCYPPLARPNEAAIDRALTIYEDLLHATSDLSSQHPQDTIPHSRPSPSEDPPHVGPNGQIYSILLRTLSSSANAQKYFPKALSLLDDMESRNIVIENTMTVASVTILLMRSSSSYAEALDAFKRISNSRSGPGLDAKGYAAILNAFCKLAFDRRDVFPSVEHYFQIIKEMRRTGHGLTAEVYTILLRQLARGAKVVRPGDLVACIRTVHRRLVLDASLSPDVALWNQLMDAYQRAGFFLDAHSVWDMLFISDQYDNASVSIILDACMYADAWSVATRICSRLFEMGFSFNRRNWNGWLECMCRLDKLDEAVKLACLEMGKGQPDTAADAQTVRILLKFAKGEKRTAEVRSRIKTYLPDVWRSILDELPNQTV